MISVGLMNEVCPGLGVYPRSTIVRTGNFKEPNNTYESSSDRFGPDKLSSNEGCSNLGNYDKTLGPRVFIRYWDRMTRFGYVRLGNIMLGES